MLNLFLSHSRTNLAEKLELLLCFSARACLQHNTYILADDLNSSLKLNIFPKIIKSFVLRLFSHNYNLFLDRRSIKLEDLHYIHATLPFLLNFPTTIAIKKNFLFWSQCLISYLRSNTLSTLQVLDNNFLKDL